MKDLMKGHGGERWREGCVWEESGGGGGVVSVAWGQTKKKVDSH